MSLLTAQIIGEKVVGVEIGIPPKSIVAEPFKVEDIPSLGFADISSISFWNEFGIESNYLKKDFLYIRSEISKLINKKAKDTCIGALDDPSTVTPETGNRYCVGDDAVGEFVGKQKAIAEWSGTEWIFLDKDVLGYSLCDREEKQIAAQLNIGLIDDHKVDFDPIETKLWREEYHTLATETRLKRMLAAETLIQQELPAYQGFVLLTITSLVIELDLSGTGNPQLYSIDLHKNYKDFGVKGTIEDYHPIKNPSPAIGIMDFFYGRSLFTNKGLINMPFVPKNMGMQQLCDRVYDILVLGNTLDSLNSEQ